MSKGFYTQVKGLEGVIKKFEKMDQQIAKTIDLELDVAAENVARDARAHAPKRRGTLVNSISADTSKKYNKTIGASAPFAAFVEFGTGSGVFKGGYQFTAEEKNYAKQFFVSGKGRIKSRAFLFPALHREIPRLIQRISDVVRTAINK